MGEDGYEICGEPGMLERHDWSWWREVVFVSQGRRSVESKEVRGKAEMKDTVANNAVRRKGRGG